MTAQQLACGPGPKARRETRDANAEEATGEKQLLRLEKTTTRGYARVTALWVPLFKKIVRPPRGGPTSNI
jgi:hypothetical protein